jgi:hypothetical protein
MWPAAVDDDVERGIADDTAVPVSLAVDHCARETRWQAAAGPNIAGEPVYQRDVDRFGQTTSGANGPALTATTMYRCTAGSIDTRVPNNESDGDPAYADTFV